MTDKKTETIPETDEVPAPPEDAQPPAGDDPFEDASEDVPQTTEVLS